MIPTPWKYRRAALAAILVSGLSLQLCIETGPAIAQSTGPMPFNFVLTSIALRNSKGFRRSN